VLTLGDAFAGLRRRFAAAGLATPDLDARILTLAATGLSAAELALRPGRPVLAADEASLAAFAARRLKGEPVARILGEWEFWGLPFALSPDTLVPRPETETVVETALRLRPEKGEPLRIVDLGTGSGCILVALLVERPAALGIGTDRSRGALATARRNAKLNDVERRSFFAGSDWGAALRGPCDLIVSNPPYIASALVPTLGREVRDHDPHLALDGGADGLAAYRAILADAPRLLAPGGHLVLEIGYDQGEAIAPLIGGLPLEILTRAADLSGRPRCVALKRT
jgi:release factor glutamine methyltransferase